MTLLQYYSDKSFGYGLWDELDKRKKGAKVQAQQKTEETREQFFDRVKDRPQEGMYGSDERRDRRCHDENPSNRALLAHYGYGLDKFIEDQDYLVRGQVALRGYGLDKLIDDPTGFVRKLVARQGYGLDKLVHDSDPAVRREVAIHGYGLNILIKDKSQDVRQIVAFQGYRLEELIDDESSVVRSTVASQGYGIDLLISDFSPEVRHSARLELDNLGISTVEKWIEQFPDRVAEKRWNRNLPKEILKHPKSE